MVIMKSLQVSRELYMKPNKYWKLKVMNWSHFVQLNWLKFMDFMVNYQQLMVGKPLMIY
jgi:hypothetical protein